MKPSVLVLAAVALCGVSACSQSPKAKPSAASSPSPGAVTSPAQAAVPSVATDPIAAAELREKALDLLSTEAIGQSAERRANAVEALIATPGRLKAVLPAALADVNPGVRTVGTVAVGRLKLTEFAPLVQPLLNDSNPMVRAGAAYALKRTGAASDISVLGQTMFDPSTRVRAHTAYLLGELGDQSAKPMILDAARQTMNRAAAVDLRLMRLQFAEALVKLGAEDSIYEVRAALYPATPEDLEATALAAQIIGDIGDRGSIDQLVYLTTRTDERQNPMPAEVRLAAAASLAKLGLPQGSFLAEEFSHSEKAALRAQSAYVYGQTGLKVNLAPLGAALNDPSGEVRVYAAAAILKITDRTH